MTAVRIQTGATEPISLKAVNRGGSPLIGLTDLFIRIRRFSDGHFFDFSDNNFKTAGSVVQINSTALAEIDPANAPGLYELSGGFDFSSIVNPEDDDTYLIIPLQTPGSNAALPVPSEIKEGQYVDEINAILTSIVSAELTAAAGSSALQVRTDATQPDGYYDEMVLVVVNASGTVARRVEAYLNANGQFTLDSVLPFTPSVGDRVLVVNAAGVGTQLTALQAQVDKIDLEPTVGPSTAATGSLLDRLANKDTGKTYNQATDSLEALKDKVG